MPHSLTVITPNAEQRAPLNKSIPFVGADITAIKGSLGDIVPAEMPLTLFQISNGQDLV